MSNKTKAVLLLVLYTFFIALMQTFSKLAGDIPAYEKVFFRGAVMLAVTAAIVIKERVPMRTADKRTKSYLWCRGVFGTFAVLGNFYSMDKIHLSDATMLNKISPFFTVLFCWLILKEKVRPVQILLLLVAFCGALFIIKPSGDNVLLFPAVIACLGGIAAALAFTYVRAATRRGAPDALVVLYFAVISTVGVIPMMLTGYVVPDFGQFMAMIACGVCSALGHLLNTKAYAIAPAGEISIIDYTQVLFTVVFGLLFFGEMADGYSIVGYVIIIGAGILNIFMTGKNPRRSSEAP